MVNIRPFKALRPRHDLSDQVCCPPWDVLSEQDVKNLAQNNPYSLLHITRPEVFTTESDSATQGKKNLDRFIKEETLKRDQQESFYIYQIQKKDHRQTGLLAAVACQDYFDGHILLHEHTISSKEDERAKLIATHNACAEPVFYFCLDHQELNQLFNHEIKNQPLIETTDEEGAIHRLWSITDPQTIKMITKYFSSMNDLYIADGHHRSAGAARFYQNKKENISEPITDQTPWTHMLAAIFPASQVKILSYNRVVKDFNGLTEDQFLEKLKEKFTIDPVDQPNPPQKCIDFYLAGKWSRLTLKDHLADKDVLDVALLQNEILDPILNIKDPRKDKRIDFIGGDDSQQKLRERCDNGWAVAFYLHPVSIKQLSDVADQGGVMPPKSTWFDPKLRSGLVLLPFWDDKEEKEAV